MLDGIVIGRSLTSNAILVYNPHNRQYYEPDSYRLAPYQFSLSIYPSIVYNGRLFVSLHREDIAPISKPYPPGTRVEDVNPHTNTTQSVTVMDISMDPNRSPHYLVQFDDGSSRSIPSADMPSLIPKPPVNALDSAHLLPPFLKLNSKIMFEHDGHYHKVYLSKSSDGSYHFSYKLHINKKQEDWGVPLSNLPMNWHELCTEGVLIPGHVSSSFLCSALSLTTFGPIANFVSTVNLVCEYPRSLLTALADKHPDREVWLKSYFEEKRGIESLGTYEKLSLTQYHALSEKSAPKAVKLYSQCLSSQSNGMRCSIPSELSLGLLFLATTTKIVSGPSWTSMPLIYVQIPCSLSSVWPSNAVVPSSKVIAKRHFVKAFYLWTRSLLSSHQLGIQKLPKKNIGSLSAPCMAFVTAHGTST
jgi:hypothetical protein